MTKRIFYKRCHLCVCRRRCDFSQGCKVFYLIEPTDKNLALYEEWMKASGVFWFSFQLLLSEEENSPFPSKKIPPFPSKKIPSLPSKKIPSFPSKKFLRFPGRKSPIFLEENSFVFLEENSFVFLEENSPVFLEEIPHFPGRKFLRFEENSPVSLEENSFVFRRIVAGSILAVSRRRNRMLPAGIEAGKYHLDAGRLDSRRLHSPGQSGVWRQLPAQFSRGQPIQVRNFSFFFSISVSSHDQIVTGSF